ncbi:MAG: UDP-N-acetylmuramoyl-tripeptide--D-alanyl-D-alanine ligase [Parcubacteria group bacterium]|nr:UDP-N-acetylmuramoyl-tripeptide--D-alanyl-D-alanine ligase [Parcubacteria group bacterium]
MMPLRNLLYLLQLEEYELKRFSDWLKNNPDRVVLEKKKHIDWTLKIKMIFVLANIFNIFVNAKLALEISTKILSPVDNILKKSLIFLASQKIKKMPNLTVIGITGSYGKTTTKDALYHILTPKYKTLRTEGNYNTLLGVAKTIIRNLRKNHEIFICEIAAYQPGDIKSITKLIKPKIGIITAIGPMHLERFKTRENILKTKMELIESLPEDGLGLIPRELESQINNFKIKSKIAFFNSKEELLFKIAAFFDVSPDETLGRIKTASSTPHRQQIIKTSANITIIDDTYNSNPAGFNSALELLKNTSAERRILVTPGMIELGAEQFELNKEAARSAAKIADYTIVVGETNKDALTEGLKEVYGNDYISKVYEVSDLDAAKSKLSELTIPNSAILLENDLPDHYF